MSNNKIQDERILLERRIIQSTAYAWIVMILLISIVVQQFLMKAPFAQYAVELYLLIGCGLYNIISNLKRGIDIWNPSGESKIKLLLNTVISGIASVILFAFLSGEYGIKSLAGYFLTFVAIFFAFRLLMIKINNKKQKSIEERLDEDETGE